MAEILLKVKVGRYLHRLTVKAVGERLEFEYPFNKELTAEIKAMKGSHYHGYDDENPRKIWSVSNCARNLFQLAHMSLGKPYAPYDCPLVPFVPARKEVKSYQVEMASHVFTRRQCILAAEMRTGKTLTLIEVMEQSGVTDWLWVGPRSALYGVQLEFKKWRSKITPTFITYDGLRKYDGTPQGVVFDESSRLKSPTALRSLAGEALSERMRAKYKREAWIVEMTGSPSPKDPADWFMQAEIACPGYIREGTIQKFKNRLAIIVKKESPATGGTYPHLVTWKDDENKCDTCGQLRLSREHDMSMGGHTFVPSVNEVAYLYKRLKGLVMVKFKKDCLKELPPMQYEKVILKPTPEIKRLASIIKSTSPSAIQCLTLMRELSDGFQYTETKDGTTKCPACSGTKTYKRLIDIDDPERPVSPEEVACGHHMFVNPDTYEIEQSTPLRTEERDVPCEGCNATGLVDKIIRSVDEIPTPKEEALKDLIDLHDEVGRLVVYAGFTGSIERCISIVKRMGWEWIRADGSGWSTSLPGGLTGPDMLAEFASGKTEKLVFVGQPSAAGMGIDLSASPSIVYYSNDFNAESRIQSSARIHSLGMNMALGATIYDLLHLPCDYLILDNLEKKLDMQSMTLGVMKETMELLEQSENKRLL